MLFSAYIICDSSNAVLLNAPPNKCIQQLAKWLANRMGDVRPAELKQSFVWLNLTAAVLSWFSCFGWILLLSYNISCTNTSNLKCFTDVCHILWALNFTAQHMCIFLHNYLRNLFFFLGTRINGFIFIYDYKRFRILQKQNWNIKGNLDTEHCWDSITSVM